MQSIQSVKSNLISRFYTYTRSRALMRGENRKIVPVHSLQRDIDQLLTELLTVLELKNFSHHLSLQELVTIIGKNLGANSAATALIAQFFNEAAISQMYLLLLSYSLALKSDGCSLSTIKNYRSDISQFITFTEETALNKIMTKPKLQAFLKEQKAKGLATASIRRKLVSITQFGIWLELERILPVHSLNWLSDLSDRFEKDSVTDTSSSLVANTNNRPKESHIGLTKPFIRQNWRPFASNENLTPASSLVTNNSETQKNASPLKGQEQRFALKKRLYDLRSNLTSRSPKYLLPYLNLLLSLILFLGMGYFGYQQVFGEVEQPLAYPTALTRPNRTLSFQGRLTDSNQNPIITASDMQFRLYDSGPSTTGGNLLWDSGTCSITPDQDGIFAAGLGEDCGSEIDASVFSENSNVWLQVEIESEVLDPRQSIKSVAYALNSETLQGFPPADPTTGATNNTVLVMNNSGEVVLGQSNPKLDATSGTFTIEAQTLTLQTGSGSNGSINLDPDGTGKINLLANVDVNGYIKAPGATLSATYAGGTALTLNAGPSATADILRWQNSAGSTLGVIDESGNIGIGSVDPAMTLDVVGTGRFSSLLTTSGISNSTTAITNSAAYTQSGTDANTFTGTSTFSNGTYSALFTGGNVGIGSATPAYLLDVNGTGRFTGALELDSSLLDENDSAGISGQVLSSTATGVDWIDLPAAGANYWKLVSGTVSPFSDTLDVTIGNAATDSAKFAFMNVNAGTPAASVSTGLSGNSMFMTADGTLSTTRRADLTIGNSSTYDTTGAVLLNPNGTGNVGIGTSAPIAKFSVVGAEASSTREKIFTIGLSGLTDTTTIAGFNNGTITNGLFAPMLYGFRNANVDKFVLGNVGLIGATADVAGYEPLLLFDASITNSSADPTNGTYSALTNRNLFGVSTGTQIKFVVGPTGNVGVGTTAPADAMHVVGNVRSLANSANDGFYAYSGVSATSNNIFSFTRQNSPANGSLAITAFNAMGFTAGATGGPTTSYQMLLNTAGNLGIGDTTPTYLLDVNGTGRFVGALELDSTLLDVNNAAGTNGQVLSSTGTGVDWIDLPGAGTNYWKLINGTISPFSDTVDVTIGNAATDSAKFAFMNVNAGTPAASVSTGLSGNSAYLTADGTLATTRRQNLTLGNSSTYDTSGHLVIHPNGTGNVGIGTTNPTAFKLQIAGNIGPQTNDTYDLGSNAARWKDLYLGGESLHIGASTSDEGIISYDTSNNIFNFGTDSTTNGDIAFFTDDLYLDKSAGNVGIGSTTPGQALDVVGNVRISGLTASRAVFTNGSNDLVTSALSAALLDALTDETGTGVSVFNVSPTISTSLLTDSTSFDLLNTTATTINFGGVASTLNIGPASTTATSINLAGGSTDTGCTVDGATGNFSCTGNIIGANTNLWQYANGAISPGSPYTNNTDVLIGGDATASAKFAFMNVMAGTPAASVSSGLSGTSMFMTADGTLSTTRRSSLTIGNSSTYNTTGNVLINPNGTGNLGIGTSAPVRRVEIADSGALPLSLYRTANSALFGVILEFALQDSTNARHSYADIYGGITTNTNGAEAGHLVFRTSTAGSMSEKMRISETGNVGIGTTDPGAKLEVAGNILLSGANPGTISHAGIMRLDIDSNADSSSDYLDFTHDGGTSLMRILESGNVGIGTTTADYTLELAGATAPRLALSDTGLAHGITDFAQTDSFFSVEQVTNDDGGARVWGFSDSATQNPLRMIGVFGTDPTDTIPGIWLLAGKRSGTNVANLDDGETLLQVGKAGTGAALMTILGNGNMGIGTITPSSQLHIKGDSTSSNLEFETNTFSTKGYLSNYQGSTMSLSINRKVTGASSNTGAAAAAINLVGLTTDSYLTFYTTDTNNTAPTERMRIDKNGNVGIGTTGPIAPLHVVSVNEIARFAGGTAPYITIGNGATSASGGYIQWDDTNNRLNISPHGLAAMSINQAGNIGIGTTTAFQILTIRNDIDNSAISPNVDVQGAVISNAVSVSGSYSILKLDTGGNDGAWLAGVYGGNNVVSLSIGKYTSSGTNSNWIFGDNNMNVGIGTTTPARRLHVFHAADTPPVRFQDSSGFCEINPISTTWTCTSDVRLKKDIASLSNAENLDKLLDLRAVSFLWKNQTTNEKRYGLVAQEVEKIFPEFVNTDEKGMKSVAYGSFGPIIISAIQEQQRQISQLASATPNNVSFTSDGELTISGQSQDYAVTAASGSRLENILSASKAVVGKITAGLITTKELVVQQSAQIADLSVTNLTISGQTINDYIRGIIQQEIQTTSLPAGSLAKDFTTDTLTVNKNASISGQLAAKSITTNQLTATTSAFGSLLADTASISGDLTVSQDASIAGSLIASNVTAESSRFQTLEARMAELEDIKAQTAELVNATVSGTLYADNIYNFDQKIAESFQKPTLLDLITQRNQNSVEAASPASIYEPVEAAGYQSLNPDLMATDSAILALNESDVVLGASALFVEKYLEVNGHAYVAQSLGIGNVLKVGNSLTISDGTIDYQPAGVETPVLAIQSSGKGKLDFLAGVMSIEKGQVAITGDLTIAGKVKADTLLTNLVQPADFGNPFQVQVAGASTESGEIKKSRFEIINETGQAVASFDADGNATFQGGVSIGNQNLTTEDANDDSVSTDKSSGQAKLTSGKTDLKIRTPKATPNSLIYVTPKDSTNNKVLFIKGQGEGEFTVGFDESIGNDVEFNWWIVN